MRLHAYMTHTDTLRRTNFFYIVFSLPTDVYLATVEIAVRFSTTCVLWLIPVWCQAVPVGQTATTWLLAPVPQVSVVMSDLKLILELKWLSDLQTTWTFFCFFFFFFCIPSPVSGAELCICSSNHRNCLFLHLLLLLLLHSQLCLWSWTKCLIFKPQELSSSTSSSSAFSALSLKLNCVCSSNHRNCLHLLLLLLLHSQLCLWSWN